MRDFEKLNSYLSTLSANQLVNCLEVRVLCGEEEFSFGAVEGTNGEQAFSRHLITSTSKVFASCLVHMLEREGFLSLADPIVKYLSQDEYRGLVGESNSLEAGSVTLRQLLSHTSGIPSYYSRMALPRKGGQYTAASALDPGWDFERALKIAKTLPMKRQSPKKAEYSFTNFLILSKILERATGLGLKELLDVKIFQPLGLTDTTLLHKQNLEEFESISSVYFGKELYLGARRIASLGLDGAIISSTKDVLSFAKALVSGKLGDGILQCMKQDFKLLYPGVDYGLGLMRFRFPGRGLGKSLELFGHLGASGHFLLMNPEKRLFVAGTTNQLGRPLLTLSVVRKIAKLLA
jgi:D-alanyl-D-alanine carboxypeptidase